METIRDKMSCNEDIDPGLVELVIGELMYTYAPVGKMIRKLETRILRERLASAIKEDCYDEGRG